MDPLTYLRSVRPFGSLSEAQLSRLAAALEIVYVPKGSRVAEGEASGRHVWLIRKGTVRVHKDGGVAHLEDAEVFGGLVGTFAAPLEAWAEEDCLLYRWPAAVADSVHENWHPRMEVPTGLLLPVGELVRRPPIWVPADTPCREAAQRMVQEGVSSVLVVRNPSQPDALPLAEVVGILTDRDLRSKVVAAGLGADAPVEAAMTSPVRWVDASTPAFAALLRMLELVVHHLPVVREGRVVGMVTDTDLMRLEAHSPLFLLKRVEAGELGRYAEEVARIARALLDGGLEVAQICRVISLLHRALCRQVVRQAHTRLGPAPVAYAWAVCGSEGREEQVLPTDQDNFLVTAGEGFEEYFGAFTDAVADGLARAGFPACPGGYMATRWRMSIHRWAASFSRWMADPQAENLVHLQVFLDFRPVAGDLSLEPLERLVASGQAAVFLGHLARSCVRFAVPLGPLRRLRATRGSVDLKAGLIAPLVCVARVLGLAAGTRSRNTFLRLEAAAEAGLLTREDAAGAADALSFGMRLRLRHQLEALQRKQAPSNEVALEDLSGWEVRRLRESLWTARQLQEGLRHRYHLYLWG